MSEATAHSRKMQAEREEADANADICKCVLPSDDTPGLLFVARVSDYLTGGKVFQILVFPARLTFP